MGGYHCGACGGGTSDVWFPRCADCGAWRSAVSDTPPDWTPPAIAPAPAPDHSVALAELARPIERHRSGLEVIDRALGGGLVWGRTVYCCGGQGAGKTTLVLKLGDTWPALTLVVSGEESGEQLGEQAAAIGVQSPRLRFIKTRDVREALATATALAPSLLIVNSLNTIAHPALRGGPGSSAQMKRCQQELIAWTAPRAAMTFMIGQLTWENRSAGPRALEHDVDVVLYVIAHPDGRRVLEVRKSRVSASPARFEVPDFTRT